MNNLLFFGTDRLEMRLTFECQKCKESTENKIYNLNIYVKLVIFTPKK